MLLLVLIILLLVVIITYMFWDERDNWRGIDAAGNAVHVQRTNRTPYLLMRTDGTADTIITEYTINEHGVLFVPISGLYLFPTPVSEAIF